MQQFGFLDTQYISFLNAQTEDAINQENGAGVSYADLFRILGGALNALASSQDPLISRYSRATTQEFVNQRNGTKRTWRRGAEYTPGRPEVGAEARGYQLPLWSFEIDLAVTARGMRDMTPDQFFSEVSDTVTAISTGHRADVLERMFHALEFPLDSRALNGNSPGFAGVGGYPVGGLDIYGKALPANYSHYFHGADSDAGLKGALDNAIAAMERFHRGRLEILPTEDMADRITSWTNADDDFVPATEILIRPAVDVSEALVSADTYLGVYKRKYPVLRPEPQVQGINAAISPTDSTSKPIAWRYKESYGRNARAEDRNLYPLTELIIMQDYGVGVLDRTGLALVSGGAGSDYINPSIAR